MKINQGLFPSLGIFVALTTLSTVYLTGFDEGVVQGGAGLRMTLKALAIGLILLPLIRGTIYKNRTVQVLSGIHFAMFGPTLLLAVTGESIGDTQWINFHLSLFVLWASYDWNVRREQDTSVFQNPLVLALVVSIATDTYVFLNGETLWANGAFIGTLGNPSIFGFVCIVGMFYTSKLDGYKRAFAGAFLLCVIVATQSLFSISAACVCFALLNRGALIFSAPAIVYVGYKVSYLISDMHFVAKLLSVLDFVSEGASEGSLSVGGRIEFHETLWRMVSENPYAMVIGHPGGLPYIAGDAGWLAYIVSYGLPIIGIYIYVFCRGIYVRRKGGENPVAIAQYVCLLFVFYMVVNRISDYWPVALIVYWHLGEILAYKDKSKMLIFDNSNMSK